MAQVGNTLYIGGDFKHVAPRTGPGVALSEADGQPDLDLPQVSGGSVSAVAPDGAGGWYIGGGFTHVGGVPRHNIAHITAAKTVDPNFDPGADSQVSYLAVSGNTVYAAGFFRSIGGQQRTGLAAIDAGTGQATPFSPQPDDLVLALAVS